MGKYWSATEISSLYREGVNEGHLDSRSLRGQGLRSQVSHENDHQGWEVSDQS